MVKKYGWCTAAIYRLGVKVFGVEEGLEAKVGAQKAIAALETFCFETLGLERSLTAPGIGREHFKAMAAHACDGGEISGIRPLNADDVEKIYEACL